MPYCPMSGGLSVFRQDQWGVKRRVAVGHLWGGSTVRSCRRWEKADFVVGRPGALSEGDVGECDACGSGRVF